MKNSKFQKRHYDFMARELRERYRVIMRRMEKFGQHRYLTAHLEFNLFVIQLGQSFERDNTSFNREKFTEAIYND